MTDVKDFSDQEKEEFNAILRRGEHELSSSSPVHDKEHNNRVDKHQKMERRNAGVVPETVGRTFAEKVGKPAASAAENVSKDSGSEMQR